MQRFIDYARKSGADSASIAPGATIDVYDAGTVVAASIYDSNDLGDPKSNPFTADAVTALFHFYAQDGRYDIRVSGTGVTTPYTWSDVLLQESATSAGIFSVADYGATGDGVTDDTTAIQNAINAAGAAGGTLLMPRGTYVITSSLFAGRDNSGTGPNLKWVKAEGAIIDARCTGEPAWDWGGVDNSTEKEMSGLRIVGHATNTPSVGILNTRTVGTPGGTFASAGWIKYDHVYTLGSFSVSGHYGYSVESNTYIHSRFTNDVGRNGLFLTDTNLAAVTSPNYTIPDVNAQPNKFSSVWNTFVHCGFDYLKQSAVPSNASAVEIEGCGNIFFFSCIFNDLVGGVSASLAPLVLISQDTTTLLSDDVTPAGTNPSDLHFIGNLFHSTYKNGIKVTATAAKRVNVKFNDWGTLSAAFGSDDADFLVASTAAIQSCDIDAPNIYLGGNVTRSCKFRVVGESGNFEIASAKTLEGQVEVDNNDSTVVINSPASAKGFLKWMDTGAFIPMRGTPTTLTPDSTNPSVAGGTFFKTANTVPTTINDFTNGIHGQRIDVIVRDANTTFDFTASTLLGNGASDFAAKNGDHITAIFDGTNWVCLIGDNTV